MCFSIYYQYNDVTTRHLLRSYTYNKNIDLVVEGEFLKTQNMYINSSRFAKNINDLINLSVEYCHSVNYDHHHREELI